MGTKRPANQMYGDNKNLPPPIGYPPAPQQHQHHHHQHTHRQAEEAQKRQRMDLVEMPASAFAKISVTSAQAGIVIGQKGSTIQQIRLLSGARVNIDSHDEAQAKTDPSKRDVREMTCVGTIEQVEAALNLLRQCFQTDNLIASAGKGAAGSRSNNKNDYNNSQNQQPQPPPGAPIRGPLPPPSPHLSVNQNVNVPPPRGSPGPNPSGISPPGGYHAPY